MKKTFRCINDFKCVIESKEARQKLFGVSSFDGGELVKEAGLVIVAGYQQDCFSNISRFQLR